MGVVSQKLGVVTMFSVFELKWIVLMVTKGMQWKLFIAVTHMPRICVLISRFAFPGQAFCSFRFAAF